MPPRRQQFKSAQVTSAVYAKTQSDWESLELRRSNVFFGVLPTQFHLFLFFCRCLFVDHIWPLCNEVSPLFRSMKPKDKRQISRKKRERKWHVDKGELIWEILRPDTVRLRLTALAGYRWLLFCVTLPIKMHLIRNLITHSSDQHHL